MTTVLDLANALRKAEGLAPYATKSGRSRILGFVYTVSLKDKDGTIKDIFSREVHNKSDMIFDIETGLLGKILRIEQKVRRR